MTRMTAVIAAALLLTASAPWAAWAADVRPPSGADTGGVGATGGGMKLPGLEGVEAPKIRTTMDEKKKARGPAVSKAKIRELRRLAIEEFGQSSAASAEASAGNDAPPPGVSDSASSFFARIEDRGVAVPGE